MAMYPKHLAYLDGWRGLAILGVVVDHFFGTPVLNTGRLGVELFFVLSGRLMAEILFVRKLPIPEFFRRRIARVWPALLLFVLAMAAAFSGSGPLHVSAFNTLAALTFTANYTSAFGYGSPVLDHMWSLCLEEHSYIFLAILAVVVRRRSVSAIQACLVVSALCFLNGAFQTWILHDGFYAVYWRTDTRASSILLGCACYLALRESPRFSARFHACSPLIFAFLGLLLSVNKVPDPLKYSLGTICWAFSVCLIDRAPRSVLAVLSHSALVWIGLLSFSLYLWQQPFAFMDLPHHHRIPIFGGLFLCTCASFYLIENPARRFLNSRWGTSKPAVIKG